MNSYKHFGVGMPDNFAQEQKRASINFERIGTNYKLSNVQAAIGLVQMIHIEELLTERGKLAGNYISMLRDCPQVKIPSTTPQSNHSYQSFCIFTDRRDEIMREMRSQGIEVQIGTYALHMHRAFNDNPQVCLTGAMPGSRYAYEHCLTLPMYHGMTEGEQMYVIEQLVRSAQS